jgi:hypothetical protein
LGFLGFLFACLLLGMEGEEVVAVFVEEGLGVAGLLGGFLTFLLARDITLGRLGEILVSIRIL